MKTYNELITEASNLRLKDIATIKLNFKKADFWVTRRGTPDTIGAVTKIFNKESFGIKITKTDIMVPDYLYYAMMNIHMQGHYKHLGTGVTNLVSIKMDNIKNIRIG